MHCDESSNKLIRPINQAKITSNMSVDSLVREFNGCAFGAGRIAEAVDIYCDMQRDDTTKFFGFAGAMVPAGMRSIVSDLIRDGYIDVMVTTGANMVHDIVESLGLHHYKGTDIANDVELKHEEINRIYDVFLPEHHFIDFEDKMQSIFGELGSETLSIRQLMTHIGKNLDDNNSILKTAADMDVPIYCPAIQDSMVGLQAWLYKQMNPLNVDAFADMKEFMDICYDAKKAGTLLIGGGVPKNYIFQSMLVTPNEFDYAIQLTMDTPETGGLSGATLDEARSWGKVGEEARSVTVYADATITLPIIVAAARSRLGK
ncbi:MAG: deoxyhypusine synthase [Methanosarcinaceae archaeon]|nr:deoxyhypusine synthase [Methanosarcinaceae archaeon]MDF1533223.1 deoxyhypusine synthase [Methanosarcinaceae archaeon]